MNRNSPTLDSSLAEETETPTESLETTLPIGLENIPSELVSLEEAIGFPSTYLVVNDLEMTPVRSVEPGKGDSKKTARVWFCLLLLLILLALIVSLMPFFLAKLYCIERETSATFNRTQAYFKVQRSLFCEDIHFPKW